eukprot:188230-Prymnesium_polylepis.2
MRAGSAQGRRPLETHVAVAAAHKVAAAHRPGEAALEVQETSGTRVTHKVVVALARQREPCLHHARIAHRRQEDERSSSSRLGIRHPMRTRSSSSPSATQESERGPQNMLATAAWARARA